MGEIGERPWGYYEVLAEGEGWKTKRICVNPGGRLSLQSHKYRAENWVVAAGQATVTVNEDVCKLDPAMNIFIPQGAKHRLENLADDMLVLIEVQTGSYLGEDDIERFDDIYGRAAS